MDAEYNPFILIRHTRTEQPFRIKYTINKPNLFVIDKISIEYNTNHNKKYYCFLIK